MLHVMMQQFLFLIIGLRLAVQIQARRISFRPHSLV